MGEQLPWGADQPGLDEEAIRKHNECRLSLFARYAADTAGIVDKDSVAAIAIERAKAAGLPEVAGLIVYLRFQLAEAREGRPEDTSDG